MVLTVRDAVQALRDGGILTLPLYSIERTDPLDRLLGDLGSGLLRIDDLSFHSCHRQLKVGLSAHLVILSRAVAWV
jgi:hypothetical protein